MAIIYMVWDSKHVTIIIMINNILVILINNYIVQLKSGTQDECCSHVVRLWVGNTCGSHTLVTNLQSQTNKRCTETNLIK
jgi:hypothetical protein